MSLNQVPELHPLRFKDLPTSIFETLENYLKLVANLQKVRTSSAVIWNNMDCLEQSSVAQIQQEFQVPIFTVGPFHKIATAASSSSLEEDTGCIVWLEKQSHNSVIYVSFGEPGSICGSDWIELLPQEFIEAVGERGCIVKWAPQMEVLAHDEVGGFWSHCCWNSNPGKFIRRGSDDMQAVLWRSLQLENELERGEIERAIRKLMVDDDDGKGMRVRARELEKIEVSMKGGSTYHSLNELVELIRSF
ncbi:Hypothetical predicted protein [Prunus dulcis]|uniref:UDP-Glycosyltransferase superfamily protein n=1 Tax=Prunus dulcis TaxID=3755 RepID=A0A5E4FQM2_PRUDU|nr:Hypothetical predicted protein [Prunus dulcis]